MDMSLDIFLWAFNESAAALLLSKSAFFLMQRDFSKHFSRIHFSIDIKPFNSVLDPYKMRNIKNSD